VLCVYLTYTGGSLQDVLTQNRLDGRRFSELELKLLLFQVAQGLKYIHSQHLVHLDIKPGKRERDTLKYMIHSVKMW